MMSILKACHYLLWESIIVAYRQHTRYCNLDTIGLRFNRMPHDYAKACNQCQRQGGISQKHEFTLTPILEVELFYVWAIDFMDLSMNSHGMKYILVAV